MSDWTVVEVSPAPLPVTLIEVTGDGTPTLVRVADPSAVTLVSTGEPGAPGQPGPPGADGAPGPAGASYEHVQAVPAATWVIVHPLPNAHPLVEVVDTAELLILADAEYVNATTVHVYHSAPVAGRALLT